MDVKVLLAMFIALIVGIVLIQALSDQTNAAVNRFDTINRSVDVSGARCLQTGVNCAGAASLGNHTNSSRTITLVTSVGRTDANCALTSVILRNSSNGTIPAANYNISYTATTGSAFINLANGTGLQPGSISNTTHVDYSYCPTGYVVNSISRTLLDLIPLFFAIGILALAIFWLRRTDIFSLGNN